MEMQIEHVVDEQTNPSTRATRGQPWRKLLPGVGGVLLVAVASASWAIFNFGSVHDAWLYAKGVRVAVEPATVILPEGKPGDEREAVLSFHNLTDKPVAVLGATTSCTCISMVDKLPVTILPKGMKELRLKMNMGGSKSGRIERTVVCYTDHPATPSLTVKIRGRLIAP